MKINGENREHLTDLNVPHLREKINKICANRPVSCVNGENPSKRMSFGSPFRLPPLGELSPKVTERASLSPESRRAAISRPFVRAILSLRFLFFL